MSARTTIHRVIVNIDNCRPLCAVLAARDDDPPYKFTVEYTNALGQQTIHRLFTREAADDIYNLAVERILAMAQDRAKEGKVTG